MLGLLLVVWSAGAAGHDLAIDQVMLWPDPSHGTLRGELTFDPELTRGKEVRPTLEHERRVVAFLNANVRLSLDGQASPVTFEVRELWVRGGATVGDLVTFSVPLPAAARELRLFASDAFRALVVSVQNVTGSGRVDTTSWLLGRGEWTPVYQLGVGWQQPGWREGGPDVFLDAVSAGADAVPGDPARGDAAPSAAAPPGSAPRVSVPATDETRAARPASLAARFVRLGFEHILPGGIDHVLFVAGLVLGSARRYRQVLISLSLFTLAHTLTLALANFQVVQVPARVVEPLIALSIFMLGLDNLRSRAVVAAERATRHVLVLRYGVVFGFGLIHGLGFASALSALAFDRDHVVLALVSFNVGVELGQIAVVVLLGLVLHLIRERRVLERYATTFGSAAIAASGLFMVFERLTPVGTRATSLSEPESCRYEV